jgi:hypothetical protein
MLAMPCMMQLSHQDALHGQKKIPRTGTSLRLILPSKRVVGSTAGGSCMYTEG